MLPFDCLEHCFILALLSSEQRLCLIALGWGAVEKVVFVSMGAVNIYIYYMCVFITPVYADAFGAARIIKMPRASPDAHSGVECSLNRCAQVRVRLLTLPCCDGAFHWDCRRRAMLMYTAREPSPRLHAEFERAVLGGFTNKTGCPYRQDCEELGVLFAAYADVSHCQLR